MNDRKAFRKALEIFQELEQALELHVTRNKVQYKQGWRELNEQVLGSFTVHPEAFKSLWYNNYESFIDYSEEVEELEAVTASTVRKQVDKKAEA